MKDSSGRNITLTINAVEPGQVYAVPAYGKVVITSVDVDRERVTYETADASKVERSFRPFSEEALQITP